MKMPSKYDSDRIWESVKNDIYFTQYNDTQYIDDQHNDIQHLDNEDNFDVFQTGFQS